MTQRVGKTHQEMRMRLFYQAGSKLSSALLILATYPANGFLRERGSPPKSYARARNFSGNDKADSRLRKCGDREDEKGGASFYGALNSDEMACSILADPNYPETDKQTADGSEEEKTSGTWKRGETGQRHF